MQEVKFSAILANACRLAGRDPSAVAIPSGWKVLAAMAIESGLHSLAAEKFPQMQRVEFRRYRPDWDGSETYEHGQEVWHAGRYWRMSDVASQGKPGVADGWDVLEAGAVARFVAFDQPWEPVVMQSFGIDTARFAYAADPRYNPDAAPIKDCRLCELGVVLPPDAPDGVFVKFVPEYPSLDASDEEWGEQTVRGEFAAYLTRLVAADLLTEDQGKFQTRAAADRELELLCERYHEGNGETRVRRGRFC